MNGKTIVRSTLGFNFTQFDGIYQPCIQPVFTSNCRVSYGDLILTYANVDNNPITKKFRITKIEDFITSEGIGLPAMLNRTLYVSEIRN